MALSLQEIKLKNLQDLTFVLHALREAPEAGLYQIGVPKEIGEKLLAMTPSQLEALAGSDVLLFGPRFEPVVMERMAEAEKSPYAKTAAMLAAISQDRLKAMH